MPHPNINGLVGLIVIESSSNPDGRAVDLANHDATLTQVFAWLAGGHRCPAGESREIEASLRPAGRYPRRVGPARVEADCRRLDAQLEHAVTQLRREIAAA